MRRCIELIEAWTAGGWEELARDERTQAAVVRKMHELTESSMRISEEVKAAWPEIAWDDLRAFRHVVVHNYLGLRMERIWEIVHDDIPTLRAQVERLLEVLP